MYILMPKLSEKLKNGLEKEFVMKSSKIYNFSSERYKYFGK